MTSVEELKNQCLPISKLKKYATEWVIKVLIIRRSLTKEYKNANGEGIQTKIRTTLFNKDVHAWNNSFALNQSYYIINGKLNEAKPNFLSDLEVAFTNNIKVVEDKIQSKTQQFLNGFISFDKAGKITDGNLVCILLKVKVLNGEGRSVRREVIVTNERYDKKVMTLLRDFTEIEGQMLQSLESDKPVLAFWDFVLSTTPISSLLINPQFKKANNLQQWNDNMKAQKIDISLMPGRLMQTARQFNAMVSGIDNNTNPWYHACKKCYRYQLKIDVTVEDQFLRITLFDVAQYYLGCDVKDYVYPTSEKIDRNFSKVETNMNVIAIEIDEVPKKFAAAEIKKLRDNEKMKGIAAEIPHVEKDIAIIQIEIEIQKKKPNRCKRTKEMSIHEVGKQNAPDESEDETLIIQLQRKRTRKVKEKNLMPHPMKNKIKVEKN
ncbi:hypothetical protein R3W88_022735 [Solanum pinnatisectum]|uniref:Uncharacterized protein n=1 Tax=Solanum pinnatisectum TaxID=50273 RepID=A0AAV9LZF2_9SOLN|nr:hypothetical protein R3W88_022735 [Solanum pinnatisectum]